MKIWAHTLVKNEERFVWYSVSSIIDYVDKMLLWDTGSTDDTLKILKALKKKYGEKIDLKIFGEVNAEEFAEVRQKMLDCTKSDWFIVSDADEIWWNKSANTLTQDIQKHGDKFESIFTPAVLVVGDMFHRLEDKAGKYKLKGKTGHYGLKAVNRNIPGLSSLRPHGSWGWVDCDLKMIQDREQDKILFSDSPFLHTTFLVRSKNKKLDKLVPKRKQKYKYELGVNLPKDYYYPEVFFQKKPEIVNSVWSVSDFGYKTKAFFTTPLKKIKRRIISNK